MAWRGQERQSGHGKAWTGVATKGSRGMARHGQAGLGKAVEARRGLARRGEERQSRRGAAWRGMAWKGSQGGAWQGMAARGVARHGRARQSRRGWAGHGGARPSRRGEAGQSGLGEAGKGEAVEAWRGMARPGEARRGKAVRARLGMAQQGMERQHLQNKQEHTMKLNKETKQQIIDEYLAETGRNVFIPREFLEYLQDKPEHDAHASFYNVSEAELAMQAREEIARKWARGLRLTLTIEVKHPDPKVSVVNIVQVEAPRLFSPMQDRSNGGGYVVLDAHDTTQQQQFKNEAANALRSFLRRYGLPLAQSGVDQSRITTIIAALENAETTEALEA